MRIFPLSDLHLCYYASSRHLFDVLKPRLPEADVLVLAGDIGYPLGEKYKTNYVDMLNLFKEKYKHVILVPGNHEYYCCKDYDRNEAFESLRDICKTTDVTLLEKSSITIGDIKFLGTTLWSAVDKPTFKKMNDSNLVFNNHISYIEEFVDSFRWLKQELLTETKEKKVVITHHLPTQRLIHYNYHSSPLNSGFATEILDLLNLKNVHLWICGHSHESMISSYGDTKLVLNPYGYPQEQDTKSTHVSYKTFDV